LVWLLGGQADRPCLDKSDVVLLPRRGQDPSRVLG
jgi:hypothetical protein